MKRYDVVIIGSGHNGLIAANYLASAGHSVLVLEASESFGGATQSLRLFPDYDALLSRYSYLISLLPRRILTDLEIDFRVVPRRIGSYTACDGPDGQATGLLVSNEDPEVTRQSIENLTGGSSDWRGYQTFQQLTHAIAQIFWPTLLEPLRSREEFENKLVGDEAREAWDWFVRRPLGESIEHFAQHDAVRGLLMTDGKIGVHTHPHDPSLLQNRCFLYHVVGNGDGQWAVPVGGMRGLVDPLVQRARRLGVEFRNHARATSLGLGENEHEVEFTTPEGNLRTAAKFVLINASASLLDRLLDQTPRRDTTDEGSVAKVNMLLRRLPRLKSGTNPADAFTGSFHLDEGYQAMQTSYQQSAAGEIPTRPPLEMYCHTLSDPSILSPELQQQGFHTLTLFGLDLPYRLFEQDHDARRAEVLQRYLTALDRVCDEPFVDCLARDAQGEPCIEIKSPVDLERTIGLDQGNIFHTAPSWFFAEQPEEVGTWGVTTPHPRVYWAGSSARRGGAVSGVPGYAAAQQVLDDA